MADDQRRHQEDAVTPQGVLHLDVQLAHRDDLTLHRHCPPDHLEGKYLTQRLVETTSVSLRKVEQQQEVVQKKTQNRSTVILIHMISNKALY